jgi:hypothetical protein
MNIAYWHFNWYEPHSAESRQSSGITFFLKRDSNGSRLSGYEVSNFVRPDIASDNYTQEGKSVTCTRLRVPVNIAFSRRAPIQYRKLSLTSKLNGVDITWAKPHTKM